MKQTLIRRCMTFGFWLPLLAAVFIVGCGPSGPATSQISGQVLFKDGTPPTKGVGSVKFEPAEGTTAEIRKTASGGIQPDGTFKMFTKRPGDGVYNGQYKVTISVWKGPHDPTSLIDEKYTAAATSPYEISVDGDVSNLKYEIEPIKAK